MRPSVDSGHLGMALNGDETDGGANGTGSSTRPSEDASDVDDTDEEMACSDGDAGEASEVRADWESWADEIERETHKSNLNATVLAEEEPVDAPAPGVGSSIAEGQQGQQGQHEEEAEESGGGAL